MASSGPPVDSLDFTAPEAGSAYAVKLSVFEGPLDLLLHLIRLNEVDITDIPIALIAEQYLEYLDLMRELNLDVAGEYLLMAATLAWIKSRMLLPPVEGEEEEEGADPRAELIARLLEYQRFKEAAEELRERQILGRDVFEARGSSLEGTPEAEREIEVGMIQLLEAFRKVLHLVESGGTFGEAAVFYGGTYPAGAQAVKPSRVVYVDGGAFLNLIERNSVLAVEIMASLSARLREFARLIEALSLKEVSARLAKYLLDEAARTGSEQLELSGTKAALAAEGA